MTPTPPLNRGELLAAIEDWHSGTMTELDAIRFKELLQNDIHACQTFVEYGDMLMCLSLEAGNSSTSSVDSRIADTLSASRSQTSSRRRVLLAMIAVCSLGLLFVLVSPLFVSSRWNEALHSGPVAEVTLTYLHSNRSVAGDSNRGNSPHLQPGHRLSALETVWLQNADEFVEIRFTSSARVLLQGPARLIVDSGNSARLDWGRVLGSVPPAAVGFTLRVPDGMVQDLGTEFAVESTPEKTDVSVLVGEVLCEWKAPNSAPVSTRLQRGESVQVETGTTTFLRLDAPPETLTSLIGYRSGITGSTGDFQAMTGPPPLASQTQPPETAAARMYCERANVALKWSAATQELVPVAGAAGEASPGIRLNHVSPTMQVLPDQQGLQVDSCLVVVRAPDRKTTVVTGTVTFEREIVGLISETALLAASDSVFGFPEFAADWQQHPSRSRGSNESADKLEISADGHTLNFTLQASGAIDELRILLRSRDGAVPLAVGLPSPDR